MLAVPAALVWWPIASAVGQVIESPGSPLSRIYVSKGLGCQVQSSADAKPSFFGGSEPAACGTFLTLTEESRHLFGSGPPSEVVPEEKFLQIEQTPVEGKGTEAEPFVITSIVGAYEPGPTGGEVEVAELTETDSYVAGHDFYTTKVTVRNNGSKPLRGTLYHAGRCQLADSPSGYGAQNVPAAGSVACTLDPANNPPSRYLAFTPVVPAGSYFVESLYSNVWGKVNPKGTDFPDTVEATARVENGIGLSWPIRLEFENAEAEDRITLQSLRRVAAALDCNLVYALVPKAGSILELEERRTREDAARDVLDVEHTMALEDQATGNISKLIDDETHRRLKKQ